MKFSPTPIAGVTLVDFAPHRDTRGVFQRVWCRREFEAAGLPREIVQVSLSETKRRGTLRGMHFQMPPSREHKLVQCVRGRVYDVALDLRARSDTFLAHHAVELSDSSPQALFIPTGCAHGFLTLTDNCTLIYMMTDYYDATASRGVRWNDPAFNIVWPEQPVEIIPRDANYPDLEVNELARFDWS